MKPFVIILDGAPKSGKTTLALALQEEIDVPLLYLDLDDLFSRYSRIDPYVFEKEGVKLKNSPDIENFVQGYTKTIGSFVSSGVSVIADTILTKKEWYELLKKELHAVPWYFIGLKASIETLKMRAREAGEGEGLVLGRYEDVYQDWKKWDLVLQTDRLSVEREVEEIRLLIT
jgi:chloramphenicol 3-O phosphotransferase